MKDARKKLRELKKLTERLQVIFRKYALAAAICAVLFIIIKPIRIVGIIALVLIILYVIGTFGLTKYVEKEKQRVNSLIKDKKIVYADIVNIDVDPDLLIKKDDVAVHPYFFTLKYKITEEDVPKKEEKGIFKIGFVAKLRDKISQKMNHQEADGTVTFVSDNILYNPCSFIQSDKLPVFVDLTNPGRYHVDTRSLISEKAILHKFRYDSEINERNLKSKGRSVTARICGIEYVGFIAVDNLVMPRYIEIPHWMKQNFVGDFAGDESKAFGYIVLCEYRDNMKRKHIFASRGKWGIPDDVELGAKVQVYCDGKNYEKYHVEL